MFFEKIFNKPSKVETNDLLKEPEVGQVIENGNKKWRITEVGEVVKLEATDESGAVDTMNKDYFMELMEKQKN